MPRLNREREAKLALLEALASSQRAVARMLDSTADLNARFPGGKPEDVAAMLARLAGLQLRMCESLLGVKLRRVMQGRPAGPWLSDERLRMDGGQGEAPGGAPARTACLQVNAPAGKARSRKMRRGGGPVGQASE
ncbi:MAG: hypothetical protein C6W59_07065 [Paenibacillaceae bacterium]|jgi:hypothetical protein|nr:MAG: hypothetical protein C6W59_07065 [Paenibacillaceae bacterium]